MIQLKDINNSNFNAAINIDIGNNKFLKDITWQLALSYVYPSKIPLLIYYNDKVIGFISYEIDNNPTAYDILTFVIDVKYRNKNYGLLSMEALKKYFKQLAKSNLITLNYNRDNVIAEKFYIKCGFVKTDKLFNDEIIMEYRL